MDSNGSNGRGRPLSIGDVRIILEVLDDAVHGGRTEETRSRGAAARCAFLASLDTAVYQLVLRLRTGARIAPLAVRPIDTNTLSNAKGDPR